MKKGLLVFSSVLLSAFLLLGCAQGYAAFLDAADVEIPLSQPMRALEPPESMELTAAAGLIGLLSLAVGGVLGYLISEVLFLGSNRKYRKSIHMLRWNLCKKTLACNAEARGFYGVDEDGIVTKCYECFDPAFTLKDVSVSVRQGELFLAPACRYVFVYGDQDFGRYAIPFGEIADCSLADWGKVEAVSVTLRDGRRVMLGKRAWEQCKNIRLREGGEEERATEEKGRE